MVMRYTTASPRRMALCILDAGRIADDISSKPRLCYRRPRALPISWQRDSFVRRRPAQLALRGHGRWRQCQCEPLLAYRDLQGERNKSLPLPRRTISGAAVGENGRRLRGAVALAPLHAHLLN